MAAGFEDMVNSKEDQPGAKGFAGLIGMKQGAAKVVNGRIFCVIFTICEAGIIEKRKLRCCTFVLQPKPAFM